MADAPLDRGFTVGNASPPATCTGCHQPKPTGQYGLVRRDKGVYDAVCYHCRPALIAQPARLSGGL